MNLNLKGNLYKRLKLNIIMSHKKGKGMTGRTHSDKTKIKMSVNAKKRKINGMLNKNHSDQTKQKISICRIIKLKTGEILHPMKGKHNKKETIDILRVKCGNKKEKHPNWQGGITNEEYGQDWTIELKKQIRKRDKWTCQICNCKNKILDVHHIDYNKKNNKPENLITLCHSCHCKTNFNRQKWRAYFGA